MIPCQSGFLTTKVRETDYIKCLLIILFNLAQVTTYHKAAGEKQGMANKSRLIGG